jgi:UDP-glucose 4-epimerase
MRHGVSVHRPPVAQEDLALVRLHTLFMALLLALKGSQIITVKEFLMKVLVTGGAGFIGSHVVDTLLEAGHHVVVLDNLWEHGGGKMENVNPRAIFYEMDIRDPALQNVFEEEQPQAICHLAAQHSVKISTDDPSHDASVNILGLINLLQNATRFGVRKIIFSSSGATYGTVEKMPVDENTRQNPESPYGTTKMASEFPVLEEHVWTGFYNSSLRQCLRTATGSSRGGRCNRHFFSPNPA